MKGWRAKADGTQATSGELAARSGPSLHVGTTSVPLVGCSGSLGRRLKFSPVTDGGHLRKLLNEYVHGRRFNENVKGCRLRDRRRSTIADRPTQTKRLLAGLEAIQSEPHEATEPVSLKRRDFWASPFPNLADVD
jgi:hypothetical protein